jgi:hypothetical protein
VLNNYLGCAKLSEMAMERERERERCELNVFAGQHVQVYIFCWFNHGVCLKHVQLVFFWVFDVGRFSVGLPSHLLRHKAGDGIRSPGRSLYYWDTRGILEPRRGWCPKSAEVQNHVFCRVYGRYTYHSYYTTTPYHFIIVIAIGIYIYGRYTSMMITF